MPLQKIPVSALMRRVKHFAFAAGRQCAGMLRQAHDDALAARPRGRTERLPIVMDGAEDRKLLRQPRPVDVGRRNGGRRRRGGRRWRGDVPPESWPSPLCAPGRDCRTGLQRIQMIGREPSPKCVNFAGGEIMVTVCCREPGQASFGDRSKCRWTPARSSA